MKSHHKYRTTSLLLVLIFTLILTGCDSNKTESVITKEYDSDDNSLVQELTQTESDQTQQALATGQRTYRTNLQGDGQDVVTLMIYLCGSDLESRGGAATADLIEIKKANISENLNIVVESGGTVSWKNELMNADTNERWLVENDGIKRLEDVGMRNMSSGDTLTDFITYSAKNFPADRYMLVLWDHGGGTVGGYAYDERYENTDMMSISELNQALTNANVVFDMIGFDCCLMGTVETAFMIEKYADYMVASQRVEPGNGWYYTPWINALSQNTSIPTDELGRIIVDSFIEESEDGYFGNELTLSVIDLTYITDLFESLAAFFSEAEGSLVEDKTFIATAQALGQSRAISDNEDLVDLAYLIESMNGSDALLKKLEQCVVYNGTTIDNHNGLCLYFPYTNLNKVSYALDIYNQIGINDTYQQFITTFANLMIGGQIHQMGGTQNPMGGGNYESDYWLGLGWVDEEMVGTYSDFYDENSYDSSELLIEEKGNDYVLSLSDESWEMITDVQQRVFLDDGDGYIDLGADSNYEFDEDGDLLIEFDNTWVALDDYLVCFYTMGTYSDEESWYIWGVVPVLFEDKDAELVIIWDDQYPEGYVAGWRYVMNGGISQKGLFQYEDGMKFDILCDFYTYDGEFDDQYLWGELIIDGPLTVSFKDVGDADSEVYYELYDIYQNTYWTESVYYSLDY